jgi:hypothetical protein
MKLKYAGMLAAALAVAAVPAAIVFAQAPGPERRAGLSADARTRLLEGRFAMAKTALNLTNEQLQLWTPVEQHLRASAAEREKRRHERRQLREQGATPPPRPSFAERVDRAAERMVQRAERMKAFSAVFKPFYQSLDEEQKAVAGVVLRQLARDGMRGRGHRWAARQAPPAGPGRPEMPKKQ